MTVRVPLDPKKFGDVLGAMLGLNKVIDSAGFDHKLIYLVEVRVSQINGWNRFCISFNATPGTYVPGSLRKSGVAQASAH